MGKMNIHGSPCRFRGRIAMLRILGVLGFVAVALKIAVLQIVWHEPLTELGDRQFIGTSVIVAPRGNITDRNGGLMAVELSRVYNLACDASRFQGDDAVVEALSRASGIGRARLDSRLDGGRGHFRLAGGLNEDAARRIRRAGFSGVYLEQTGRRYYPNERIAGNLLGRLTGKGRPLCGAEARFDSLLRGRNGVEYHVRTASGRAHSADRMPRVEPVPGSDIELCIDLRYQTIAEEELARALERWEAASAQLVLLDPRKGRILALVSLPGMDSNELGHYDPAAARQRTVSDQFEPGSTLKLVTFAAALEAGAIGDLQERVDCLNGRLFVHGVPVRDSNGRGYDTLTVEEIFTLSSNIGTVLRARRMQPRERYIMARNFGIGRATGVDLPNEVDGHLPRLERWGPVEYANIAMGQGVAVNALQMACAFGVVANDGVLIRPRVLQAVRGKGTRTETRALRVRRVIQKRTARILRRLMRETVLEGTGKEAAVDGIRIFGKTGTAQKIDPETGAYSREDYVSSFGGFAEIEGRPLVCFVLLDTPRGEVYGGTVAAPVFRSVMQRIVMTRDEAPGTPKPLYWAVESDPAALPDPPAVARGVGIPDLSGMCLRDALCSVSHLDLEVQVIGSGAVEAQDPRPGGDPGRSDRLKIWLE